MKKRFGVIILSGGTSLRMGKPKAFLKTGNTSFINQITTGYLKTNPEKIIVIVNRELYCDQRVMRLQKKNLEIVCNSVPELGRSFSIKLGIHYLPAVDFCFIHNIDNPGIDSRLIEKLKIYSNANGYTVPVHKNKSGHPVLVSSRIINRIKNMVGFDFNLRELLNEFTRHEVPVNENEILLNINTKSDYLRYREYISQKLR